MQENGLIPIRAATWGPFVLISLAESKAAEGSSTAEEGWLDSAGPILTTAGVNSSLHHVATREYVINCNWKVNIEYAILCITMPSLSRDYIFVCSWDNLSFCLASS